MVLEISGVLQSIFLAYLDCRRFASFFGGECEFLALLLIECNIISQDEEDITPPFGPFAVHGPSGTKI